MKSFTRSSTAVQVERIEMGVRKVVSSTQQDAQAVHTQVVS